MHRALLNRICGNLQNKEHNLKETISRSTLVEAPRAVEGCWGKGVVPGATAGRGTMGGSQLSAPESRKPCGEKGQDTVNAKISWEPWPLHTRRARASPAVPPHQAQAVPQPRGRQGHLWLPHGHGDTLWGRAPVRLRDTDAGYISWPCSSSQAPRAAPRGQLLPAPAVWRVTPGAAVRGAARSVLGFCDKICVFLPYNAPAPCSCCPREQPCPAACRQIAS